MRMENEMPETNGSADEEEFELLEEETARAAMPSGILSVLALIAMPVCAAMFIVVVPRFMVIFANKELQLPLLTVLITSAALRWAVVIGAVANCLLLIILSHLRMKRALLAASLVSVALSVLLIALIFAGLALPLKLIGHTAQGSPAH